MRHSWLPAVLLAVPTCAMAQDTPVVPKAVKTVRAREATLPATLYRIDDDGTVNIDWTVAERAAVALGDTDVRPIALLMLAIRDGKWRSLPPQR